MTRQRNVSPSAGIELSRYRYVHLGQDTRRQGELAKWFDDKVTPWCRHRSEIVVFVVVDCGRSCGSCGSWMRAEL